MTRGWRFFADRGGTFTDIVALDPENRLHTHKLLSSSQNYSDPVQAGIRYLLNRRESSSKTETAADSQMQNLDLSRIEEIRVGTTIGTNALLEHKTARVGLIITRGFRDLLRIGHQSRPDLFALQIKLPELLYVSSAEVTERIGHDGRIIEPLDIETLEKALSQISQTNVDCLTVLFLNSVANPVHEIQAGEWIRKHSSLPVYLSHESSLLTGAVDRGDTTLVDAALGPLIRNYASEVESFSSAPVYFMGSSGSLYPAGKFSGKDSLLSGPAGGMNAVAAICNRYNIKMAVGFDMGGTSTDVFCYEGKLLRQDSTEVGGYKIQAPHLRIHTIASGGGSILQKDGMRLLVGPESAGARPGPAFYGLGGPATITDANVVLGRVLPSRFPSIFGEDGKQSPQPKRSGEALQKLMNWPDESVEEIAEGFLAIACEQMAGAVRKMTIEQGRDPENYTMVSFGGAGGQVACEVASRAGIKRILFPGLAGLFSAAGIGSTQHSTLHTIALGGPLSDSMSRAKQAFLKLSSQQEDREDLHLEFRVLPGGSDFHVSLSYDFWPELKTVEDDFNRKFKQLYGYEPLPGLRLSSVLVEFLHGGAELFQDASRPEAFSEHKEHPAEASSGTSARESILESIRLFDGGWKQMQHRQRMSLDAGDSFTGPILISSATDTVYIASGWSGLVTVSGDLDVRRETGQADAVDSSRAIAISSEIHQRKLESIAIEMGTVLQRTARSVNIKERLDFSCAIFDSEGRILVSAPHIPVHLGSMQDSVQAILPYLSRSGRKNSDTEAPGESFTGENGFYLLNDPYAGGTHLPDITVICPVYLSGVETPGHGARGIRNSPDRIEGKPDYFVAARGHHADVGGISPGSMPAISESIEDEGILISPRFFRRSDLEENGELEELFRKGGARSPQTNRADVAAQVAACIRGLELLQNLDQSRAPQLESYLRDAARLAVHNSLTDLLAGGPRRASLKLDPVSGQGESHKSIENHAEISLIINSDSGTFLFDFSGSSLPPVANFHTPPAVVRSAVLYSLYLIAGRSIPLNAGALDEIEIRTGQTFLRAIYPMPVVAGNVETSQVLVDTILMAVGALSPGPGTMNNLSFGNENYQYYETIGAGSGAGPGFSGTSAVQCHMTNSRITDAEILESRFPVLLEEFSIRSHSGGRGKFSGGDGLIRQIRFLEDMTVSILSNRRVVQASGLSGGLAGKRGINLIIEKHGMKELGYCSSRIVKAGEAIRIETPGGAGYGKLQG